MALKLYNTLTRKKENFQPRKKKKVDIFVCGPTVYDLSHLGHARTYIVFDMIVRYLREIGYAVFYLQNITDIDDKIIGRAQQEKKKPEDLARFFEKEYLKDIKSLGITSVSEYARATDHIKEIISQAERLLKKGFAYQIEDGLYYDISKFKEYGKLSKRTVLQAEDAVSRIDEAKAKRNKGDFCLWKFSKPQEPKWPSPFGWGRPGWHIEDTAITEKYFGPQYDIHGGAKDLIFPHHEAEVAQMEAISGKKPLVKYWVHAGFLTVGGAKMAKSLGNFITIRDFLKNHSSQILRLFILKSHYRSPIDYNEKAINQTKRELQRINQFIEKLKTKRGAKARALDSKLVKDLISKTEKDFEEAMADDFNTPRALGAIFDLIKEGNKLIEQDKISAQGAQGIYNLIKKFDRVLGILPEPKKLVLSKEIQKLVKEREEARQAKNWAEADQIRKEIEKEGFKIEDTKEGPKLSPKY